ncbi:MAG TPA: hypothetical protein PKY77_05275 [Phycisphaerae bacterium]|nr:hypothetical protein [Phycisphaerae bacterium]HRY68924.1 hypothetical protein [Phycisphaerae bacterium]HSA25751.1 hypothetical protein [Phycisphaerae bacterium]
MSYHLYFWKEVFPSGLEPGVLCDLVCEHEEPEGMARLSVSRLKTLFNEAFPGIQDHGPQLVWEEGDDGFEVAWPFVPTSTETFAFSVNCADGLLRDRGAVDRIIAIAGRLGCALYDPQVERQYILADALEARAATYSTV